MRLTDRFEDVITINGKEYNLDLAFDNVLRLYELQEEEELDDYQKVEYMFEMLFIDHENIKLTIEQKVEVIEYILARFITKEEIEGRFETNDKQKKKELPETDLPPKKIYDFNQDAELIYASFLFDYNMDLIEEHGKLHWNKFIALLNGLSEKSAFMQVIHIRTMEVPKPNKHNQKERERIMRLKRHYSLEQEQTVEELDRKLDYVAKSIIGK